MTLSTDVVLLYWFIISKIFYANYYTSNVLNIEWEEEQNRVESSSPENVCLATVLLYLLAQKRSQLLVRFPQLDTILFYLSDRTQPFV